MKKYFILVIFLLFSVTFTFAQDTKAAPVQDDITYQLILQKAIKAEKNGEYSEAVEAYEEAYEYSKNLQPLISLVSLQTRIGLYDVAEKALEKVPIKKLKKAAKSELCFLKGKIYAAKGNFGGAYVELSEALKYSPDRFDAKVRLALISLMKGMSSEAEKHIANEKIDENVKYGIDEYRMCFAVDMYNLNFSRAYAACELISKFNIKGKNKDFFNSIVNLPIFIFFSFLPLFLSKFFAFLYYIILFMALGLCASALCKKTTIWHVVFFVVAGVTLLFVSKIYSDDDVYSALLNSYCYIYDGVWILPRMVIGSHLIALTLFIIYPLFKLLKDDIRPVTYELLGIWLFCFFFGIFVLSFQSNLAIVPKLVYIAIGLIFSFLSTLIMPFGKLLVFRITQLLGIPIMGNVAPNKLNKENLSFADLKILESKIWNFLNKGEIETAIAIYKKALTRENQIKFPSFWLASILALIANEDYELAINNINNFYQIFQGTNYFEIAQIYEALLKTDKGDFSGAYKLISSIPEERAKNLSSDETAISLLVVGRCCLDQKDNVQANINLTKALSCAKSQLLKFIILTDITELDIQVKSKQNIEQWQKIANSFKCNGKCASYLNTINSMIALFNNNEEEAFKLASKNINSKIPNGKAFGWLGHLLCLRGKPSEAERILSSRMTAGSYSAECLMVEITSL